MASFDRRKFMIGSGIAVGAAVASSLVKISGAQAQAPLSGKQAPGFYRTKVGNIEVTALSDGGMTLGDELMLNTNAKTLSAARAKNFLPAAPQFPAYVNAFLVNTGDRLTLIDTGARGYSDTLGKLEEQLEAAGVKLSRIDEIVLTHIHPDHTGGLVDERGRAVFGKARVRVAQEELSFWLNAENEAKFPERKQLFDSANRNLGPYLEEDRVESFISGTDLGAGLSSVALPGHTPGHTGVRVSDGNDQLIIWGDIVHVPAVQFENPGVGIGFDLEPELARKTRAKIFDEAATDRIRVAGMHLAFPAIGHLARQGKGYQFVPQPWETDIA